MSVKDGLIRLFFGKEEIALKETKEKQQVQG